jgi:hypothetical protein
MKMTSPPVVKADRKSKRCFAMLAKAAADPELAHGAIAFGRIVVAEIEAPNLSVDRTW